MKKLKESDYNAWPHAGWWQVKGDLAKGMSDSELRYARIDCDKAARSNPDTEGKYRDEGSIYAEEQRRRAEAVKKGSKKKLGEAARSKCQICGFLQPIKNCPSCGKDVCPDCWDKKQHLELDKNKWPGKDGRSPIAGPKPEASAPRFEDLLDEIMDTSNLAGMISNFVKAGLQKATAEYLVKQYHATTDMPKWEDMVREAFKRNGIQFTEKTQESTEAPWGTGFFGTYLSRIAKFGQASGKDYDKARAAHAEAITLLTSRDYGLDEDMAGEFLDTAAGRHLADRWPEDKGKTWLAKAVQNWQKGMMDESWEASFFRDLLEGDSWEARLVRGLKKKEK